MNNMKPVGLALAIGGALTALIAWFGFHNNVPFTVGGAVFLGIGGLVFLKG